MLRAFDLYLSHDGIGVRPNGLPVGDLAFAVRGMCDGVDVCASNPGEADRQSEVDLTLDCVRHRDPSFTTDMLLVHEIVPVAFHSPVQVAEFVPKDKTLRLSVPPTLHPWYAVVGVEIVSHFTFEPSMSRQCLTASSTLA